MPPIIGVDFDNTIISYDNLMHKIAVDRNLIPPFFSKNKQQIRSHVRLLQNGEIHWQQLQETAYGPRIDEGQLIEGVQQFFKTCHQRKIDVYIVSHKTSYATCNNNGIDLRNAALGWMTSKQVFSSDGFGLNNKQVFFESTRFEKIQRIQKLRCTLFIDDLEEIFQEESFPSDIEKILFSSSPSSLAGVKTFSTWENIHRYCFHAKT